MLFFSAMGRKKQLVAGRSVTFYLGDTERDALAAWRRLHGSPSDSQALREILLITSGSAPVNMEETHGSEEEEEKTAAR